MSKLFVKKLETNGLCWSRIWIIGVGKWENMEMLDFLYWDKLMILELSVAMLS